MRIEKISIFLKIISNLDNIEHFKNYIQENFAHKEIIKLKQNDKIIAVSIFPNGKLYDMSGEAFTNVDKVWDILYEMGKNGRFEVGEKK